MRLLRHLAPTLLVVAALATTGCGDDGDETTAPAAPPPVETTAALTKEELLAQGDAICAEVNAAVGALVSSDSEGDSIEAAELYGGMVERLNDLGAPSDEAAGYSEFAAATEELAQAQGDVELAAERDEEEGLTTAEAEASSALSSFQEAAGDYGFEQCSEGPRAPAGGLTPEAGTAEEPVEGVEGEELEEEAPEAEEEEAPETGGAGSAEEGGAGGGAEAGGGSESGGEAGGGSSGGIGPG